MADSWNSGESDAPALEPPSLDHPKKREGVPFEVVCEPIGDFSKFETVVALENEFAEEVSPDRPLTPVVEAKFDVLGHVDTDFGRNLKKYGQAELAKIKYDVQYRGERLEFQGSAEEDAIISWTRKDNSLLSKNPNEFEDSGSEEDEDMKDYMAKLAEKKAKGWVTDESLFYDEERSMVRNFHRSSISMTTYDISNRQDFGNTEAFDRILSQEEKSMLRANEEVPESLNETEQSQSKTLDTNPDVQKQFASPANKLTWQCGNSLSPLLEEDEGDEDSDDLKEKVYPAWSDYVFELKGSPMTEEDMKKNASPIPVERPARTIPRNDTYAAKCESDGTEFVQARLREMILSRNRKQRRLGQLGKSNLLSDGVATDGSYSHSEKGDSVDQMGLGEASSDSKTREENSSTTTTAPIPPPAGKPTSRTKWIPRHLRPSNCASNTGGDESMDNPSEWIWDTAAGKYKDLEL